jgi:muramoyltetrapeptide carboxypeptidase
MVKVKNMPSLLNEEDKVMIIAPSGRVNYGKTKKAISLIESWGLEVTEGKHLYNKDGIFAGSDEERLSDLQSALDNPEIKAVFCARGGHGLSRIVDRLDLTAFRRYPKWIIGFSDITLLHTEIIRRTGIPVIHGEMPLNYADKDITGDTLDTLRDALFSGSCSYQWMPFKLKQGETRSVVAGGNLSMLCNILGTGLDDFLKDKILFIEDTNEHLYRIDRMLMGLRMAGVFENISGLIVGGMTDIIDSNVPFGKSIGELILDVVSDRDIPVAFDFPAGHINDNRAFYMGSEAFFRVDSLSAVLSF